jgi:lipoate-protein ligase A
MDARNNIVCNGKKLSGGAQFTNRKNILNHGTLLYSADLQMLRDCLKDNPYKVETKAVASVKSSVANIQSITGSITSLDELKSMILSAYEVKETKQLSKNEWQEVEQLASEKYATYEWVYGRSPVTTIHRNQTKLSIAEGIIIEIASDIIPNKVLMSLIGVNYSYTHIKKALGEMPNALNFLDELF